MSFSCCPSPQPFRAHCRQEAATGRIALQGPRELPGEEAEEALAGGNASRCIAPGPDHLTQSLGNPRHVLLSRQVAIDVSRSG
jgi:hypothetical protein